LKVGLHVIAEGIVVFKDHHVWVIIKSVHRHVGVKVVNHVGVEVVIEVGVEVVWYHVGVEVIEVIIKVIVKVREILGSGPG
jgi:hypothetical protein